MADSSSKPLARSTSRSKRSTTNLANLRLAPLSAKYTEQPTDRHAPKSPYEEAAEATLAKYTYRQGRSAPSTPGVSPGAVRRRSQGGGLSRRESIFDDELSDAVRNYAAAEDGDDESAISRSGSDAGLTMTPASQGSAKRPSKHKRSRTVGTNTPRSKSKSRADDDWLSRTGATANAMLLESKGATWMSSRPSSTNLVIADDDDDEGYEEMAALSASTTRNDIEGREDGNKTPRQDKWGSRFGSRPASRHQSRRGSIAAGAMTPRGNPESLAGYFEHQASLQERPVIVDSSEDDTDDDNEQLAELTKDKSFGLGPYVDKIMYTIFSLPEDGETSGADTGNEAAAETAAEAKARRMREARRRQQEKDRLVNQPAAPEPGQDGHGQKIGLWDDASWLFGVATRALS